MTMSKKKYYVVSRIAEQPQDKNNDVLKRAVWLDDTVVPGAPYFEAVWTMKDIPKGPPEHCHDFDEYIGFMSGDPSTEELGCEVTFWVDGEPVKFNKNTVLFIPAGVKHAPFTVLNVTRPVLNYSGGQAIGAYMREYEDGTRRNH
jgi:mannose-6-phosphate isomerase-like protein (cupin superfamily)